MRAALWVYASSETPLGVGNLMVYAVVALGGVITALVAVSQLRTGKKEAQRLAQERQDAAADKARLALLDPYLTAMDRLEQYGDTQGVRVDRLMEDLLECEDSNRKLKEENDRLSQALRRQEQFLLDLEHRKQGRHRHPPGPSSDGSSGSPES